MICLTGLVSNEMKIRPVIYTAIIKRG
jgi:hypothetical protein